MINLLVILQNQMSKRNKIRKKSNTTGSPVPVNPPRSTGFKATVTPGDRAPLILFDKRTKWFIGILVALYLLMSVLKLHTSSVGNWDIAFGNTESESVIAGKPKWIRMDEWSIGTPALLAQYNAGMPVSNPSIGDGNAPVIWGLPVKDISSLLRPAIWSYFLLDAERAYSFSWNFNIFFFLISMFLLLMLLTRNNFWLSVWGTLFIFLSAGVQWWSYTIATYMMYMNGALVSLIYLLYARKRTTLVLAGFLFLLSVYSYFFNLYPPFQVPLVYLYFFIFIGYILKKKEFKSIRENLFFKLGVSSVVFILLAIFIYHYYILVKDTYSLMLNTVYPGKRVSSGGGLISGKFFSEFFGLFMTDSHIPKQWFNICEESGFLFFFPVVFYVLAYNYFKFKKIDFLQLSLSVFLVISLLFLLAGFPPFLSKITLFYLSEARRFLPIAEAGNCILLICFLAEKTSQPPPKFSWKEFTILSIVFLLFFIAIGIKINSVTENFFSTTQLLVVTILFTTVYLLIRYHYIKYATPVVCLLLLGFNIRNISVNPLTNGLAPILENAVVRAGKEIHDTDPGATWAVFGDPSWADLLKSSGVKVFNGVKLVPPLKDMAVLDHSGQYDSAYNRYAHIRMTTYIDNKDTIVFQQPYIDLYTINLDPCSPRLVQLGIKYFLFSYQPKPEETRCMTPLNVTGLFLYKRN